MRNIPYDWLFIQHVVLIWPPGDPCQLLGAASATFNSHVKGPEHADNGIGHWDFQLRQVARPVIYLKKNHKRTVSHFQQPQLQSQTVNSEKPISTVGRAQFLVSDRLASIRLERAEERAAGAARPQLVRGLQTLGEKREGLPGPRPASAEESRQTPHLRSRKSGKMKEKIARPHEWPAPQ